MNRVNREPFAAISRKEAICDSFAWFVREKSTVFAVYFRNRTWCTIPRIWGRRPFAAQGQETKNTFGTRPGKRNQPKAWFASRFAKIRYFSGNSACLACEKQRECTEITHCGENPWFWWILRVLPGKTPRVQKSTPYSRTGRFLEDMFGQPFMVIVRSSERVEECSSKLEHV